MEKTSKKIIGVSIVVLLIASVGVVFASANIEDTSDTDIKEKMVFDRQQPGRLIPHCSNITDDQKTELKELINSLEELGANSSEIRAAIQQKLDELGILDNHLDNEIAQTEQRLKILNREKELRNKGYSWDEIRSIIQDEFDIQNYTGNGHGMINKHGFDRESSRGPCDFMFGEESD